jgi:hypothetical protein
MGSEATQFKPGNAVGGRKPGTSSLDKFRKAISDEDYETIVGTLVRAAKGDKALDAAQVKSAEILLNRLCAPARAAGERVVVPGMRDAETLAEKCDAVLKAIADGEISADAGRSVLSALSDAVRILQVSELEARLRKLEGKRGRTIDGEAKRVKDAGELV